MTTARALRGPFDYRLPEELRGGAVGVGSMLVVPFARREVLGVVVGPGRAAARSPRRSCSRRCARCESRRARRAGRARRVDRRRVLLDDRPRADARAAARARRAGSAGASAARSRAREHLAVGARSAAPPPADRTSSSAVLEPCSRRAAGAALRAAPAARRHRLGQDRGLPARRRRRAGAGARRDRARARDRADAADRRALHRTLRRHRRGAALAPAPGAALRGVAPPARRARRECASGRARPCSRRSRTSA